MAVYIIKLVLLMCRGNAEVHSQHSGCHNEGWSSGPQPSHHGLISSPPSSAYPLLCAQVTLKSTVSTVVVTTLVLEGWSRELDPDLHIMDALRDMLAIDWKERLSRAVDKVRRGGGNKGASPQSGRSDVVTWPETIRDWSRSFGPTIK